MLLPGPEAQQLATYIRLADAPNRRRRDGGRIVRAAGRHRHHVAQRVVYAGWGHLAVVAALFFGLKAAVLAIVLQAVIRVGRRALRNGAMRCVAAVSFVAIFAFGVSFPLIIIGAGVLGYIGGKLGLKAFQPGGGHPGDGTTVMDADSLLGEALPDHARPTIQRAMRASIVCLSLWLIPVAIIVLTLGPQDTFSDIAIFFSKMATVTFGGAYAVLAYVAQQAVDTYRWVTPVEMLDGLGMAETTPGPLIMVTQFVGFMAAYRNAHHLQPMLAGALGGLLTTWVTFVPCFLWIFLRARPSSSNCAETARSAPRSRQSRRRWWALS